MKRKWQKNFLGQLLSTVNREASIMVMVLSVSGVSVLRKRSYPVLDRMENNLLKLHTNTQSFLGALRRGLKPQPPKEKSFSASYQREMH